MQAIYAYVILRVQKVSTIKPNRNTNSNTEYINIRNQKGTAKS